MTLLHDHVERFNHAIRSGDWDAMLVNFHSDARMDFRGIPVGPFAGKEAIAAAYRNQPPDDELRILEEREREGRFEARYAWLAEPDVAAGEMFLTAGDDGLIRELVVTFDRAVSWA
jgi:steroid Delta-isomerase